MSSIRISKNSSLQITPPNSVQNRDELIGYVEQSLEQFACLKGKGFRFALLEAKLVYVPASEILGEIEDVIRKDLSIISTLQYANGRYVKALEREIESDKPYINPLQIPFSVSNSVTGWIALKHGIRGGNLTFNTSGCLSSIVAAINFISEQMSLGYVDKGLLLSGRFGGLYLSELTSPIQTYSFLIERSDCNESEGILIDFRGRYTSWNDFMNQMQDLHLFSVIIETAVDLPVKPKSAKIIQNQTECSLLCDLLSSPIYFLNSLGIKHSNIAYVIVDSLKNINVLILELQNVAF